MSEYYHVYDKPGFRGGVSLTDLLCLHCTHNETNKCIMNNYMTCFLYEKNAISSFNIFFYYVNEPTNKIEIYNTVKNICGK